MSEKYQFLTKKSYLANLIRESILNGEFHPGDQLIQQDLADRFNTSITPVREALRELESERIISYSPHRGARVTIINPQAITQILVIRVALEELAIELAFPSLTADDLVEIRQIQTAMEEGLGKLEWSTIRRLNHDLHLRMYRGANNKYLFDVIEHVWNQLPWDLSSVPYTGVEEVILQHRSILEALEQGNLPQAKRAIREHIMGWGKFLESSM